MDETRSILTQSVVLTGAAILAVAGIFGTYYWYDHRAPEAPVAVAAPPPLVAAAPASTAPEHPVDDHDADHATPLDQSDAVFTDALSHVSGWNPQILRLLLPEHLIRHIVATVDALPRDKLPIAALPTRPVPGSFRVNAQGAGSVIAAANAHRYEPLVSAVSGLDMAALAGVYKHFYPLFQQAYKELGYPKGNFNDRLVEAIDDLLDAPDPKGAVEVVAPGVMYHYVDADLEALPAGQKVVVRMGEANERAIKQKLIELRKAVAAS
jgi:hypothetical protein